MANGNYWDEEVEILSLDLNDKAYVKASTVKKNGKAFVSVREFYRTEKNPEWKPSSRGISIPKDENWIKVFEAVLYELKGDVE